MNLTKTSALIAKLRREKGLTQNKLAQTLGICSKTVSKWETGRGFPDITLVSELSKIFGVDIHKLLNGEISTAKPDSGNVKNTKFYVCQKCGNVITSLGNADITCCGRVLLPLVAQKPDESHILDFQKIDDEYYITFNHPMKKEHFILFVSYVRFDRVLTVRLYPEQGGELIFPQMLGGKMYYYCNTHGLFEIKP